MTDKELEEIKKTWAVGSGETMFEGHAKVAIGRLIQEIERLRKGLKFYAYCPPFWDEVDRDRGKVARDLLEERDKNAE